MDIRIGNDIRIDATITDYVESDQYCIKRINCVLINTDNPKNDGSCNEAFPQFCTPTKYTTHNSGKFSYNVTPTAKEVCDCGHTLPLFVDNSPHKLTFKIEDIYSEELKDHYWYEPHIKFDGSKSLLLIYYPGKHHHVCGTYKLMVFIVLYDTSWEDPYLHTVVLTLDDVFTLVHDTIAIEERIVLTCKLVLNDIEKYNISLKGDKGDAGDNGEKGEDGENALSILLFTEEGNIIVDEEDSIHIIAQVWNGLTDITDQLSPYDFYWTRNSGDEDSDNTWNNIHKHCGNKVTVYKSEFNKKALYQCNFDFESYFNI